MPQELFSLLGMLLAVAVILLLAHWATKRLANGMGGAPSFRRDSGLKILSQLPLGRDQRLVVVQAGERCLLLSATPAGISLLAELSEEERAAWARDTAQQEITARPNFQEALRAVLDSRKKK